MIFFSVKIILTHRFFPVFFILKTVRECAIYRFERLLHDCISDDDSLEKYRIAIFIRHRPNEVNEQRPISREDILDSLQSRNFKNFSNWTKLFISSIRDQWTCIDDYSVIFVSCNLSYLTKKMS